MLVFMNDIKVYIRFNILDISMKYFEINRFTGAIVIVCRHCRPSQYLSTLKCGNVANCVNKHIRFNPRFKIEWANRKNVGRCKTL